MKNILILHTDQLRYDGLGCCGNPLAVTPHIDQLAGQSYVFDRHIVANPVCMPSRASLLTGLYPQAHNVWSNGVPLLRREYVKYSGDDSIVAEPPTLADVFARGGYATFSLGKLHLTPNLAPVEHGYPETWDAWEGEGLADWHGPYYGFQYVDNTCGHGDQPAVLGGHYRNWLAKYHPDIYRQAVIHRQAVANGSQPRPIPATGGLYPSTVPDELHHTTWLANRFKEYVTARRDPSQPFCGFIGFPDPHHPFTPSYDIMEKLKDIEVKAPCDPEGRAVTGAHGLQSMSSIKHLTPAERRMIIRYTYAMVHQVDLAVGRILSTLKELDLWDNTIIVFTSDHGDFLGDHGLLYKGFVGSDALLHVPLILRVPGQSGPQRIAMPVSNCDVLPTLARLAGVKPPDYCHGRDLLDGNERHAFAYASAGQPESVNLTIYDRRYRLTYYPAPQAVELYDHQTDPDEIENLAGRADVATVQARLLETLKTWFIETTNPNLNRLGLW